MGQSSSFELHGWKKDGTGLPVSMKHEIQDVMFSTDVDDYGTECNDKDSFIMNCGSEYFGAYDAANKALSEYAETHEDVLLEMYYDCEEANEYHAIRFHGKDTEEFDRIEVYPPFVRLTLPNEDHSLLVLEFKYASIDGSPETSILVLLTCCPSADKLKEVEDSISSYIESVPAWGFEQLIHDVLSAENIGHWILAPTHTFHI